MCNQTINKLKIVNSAAPLSFNKKNRVNRHSKPHQPRPLRLKSQNVQENNVEKKGKQLRRKELEIFQMRPEALRRTQNSRPSVRETGASRQRLLSAHARPFQPAFQRTNRFEPVHSQPMPPPPSYQQSFSDYTIARQRGPYFPQRNFLPPTRYGIPPRPTPPFQQPMNSYRQQPFVLGGSYLPQPQPYNQPQPFVNAPPQFEPQEPTTFYHQNVLPQVLMNSYHPEAFINGASRPSPPFPPTNYYGSSNYSTSYM
jgi:hypothetical protein